MLATLITILDMYKKPSPTWNFNLRLLKKKETELEKEKLAMNLASFII